MTYRPRFLTPKRMQVLDLVSQGFTNEQMAERLCITVKTVENHLRQLRELTGTANSRHLVYKALRKGWITIEREESGQPQ